MSLFILNFLLLLSIVSGFTVKVTNQPIAGGSVQVEWERQVPEIFAPDPSFLLRLRKSPGNDNGDFTTVEPQSNQITGTQNVPVKDTGTFQIEVFVNVFGHKQGPFASSASFQVNAASAPQPPKPPPAQTTSPNSPNTTPTKSTETPGDPPPTGTQTNTVLPSQPGSVVTTSASVFQTVAGNAKTPPDTEPASEITFITSLNGSPHTFTAPTGSPLIFTFTSDSQTIETSIIPPVPTTFEGGSESVGAAKKSNTGVIVGAVVGSLFSLLIAALLLVFYRRRKRREATKTFFQDRMVRNGSTQGLAADMQDINEKFQDGRSEAFDTEVDPYGGTDASTALPSMAAQQYPIIIHTPPTPSNSTGSGRFSVARIPPPVHPAFPRNIAPSPPPQHSPLGLSPPRTERQMEIHEKIVQLQAKRLGLQNWMNRSSTFSGTSGLSGKESEESVELGSRIKALEGLMKSPWALGRTDLIPKEMLGPDDI